MRICDEIDFGVLSMLLAVISYGMAVEQHTGRHSVENLIAALRVSRNRKKCIDEMKVRARRDANEIENLRGKLFAVKVFGS